MVRLFEIGDYVRIKNVSALNSRVINKFSPGRIYHIEKIYDNTEFPYMIQLDDKLYYGFSQEELIAARGEHEGETVVRDGTDWKQPSLPLSYDPGKAIPKITAECLSSDPVKETEPSSADFIVKDSGKPKVYSTTVDVKREFFPIFSSLIGNQFNHGGDKYKLDGFEDREATDVISAVFGGETEFDWILGTMAKYLFRFKNFQREKDLLKIATYCYILWLKQGNHLNLTHDEDTTKGGK